MSARRLVMPALLLSLLAPLSPAAAQDQAAAPSPGWQATPWADSVMIQTQLFFSLGTTDGRGVSAQQFAQFLAEVVHPRFPDGLTVLEAAGEGRHDKADTMAVLHANTRLVLLVHANTPDAEARLKQVKAEYAKRFVGAGIFHVDFPVRIGS
ncbi:DUF3574 domain-containing protein [Xanthobacteraceae bacterium A53D]